MDCKMSSEKLISFVANIPEENKECAGDLLTSMLLKGIIDFFTGNKSSALFFLQSINLSWNIKDPREWECFEFAFFMFMHINKIEPNGKSAKFYLRKYKRKLHDYYVINRESFCSFYKNSSFLEIRNEVKGFLKRRWDKDSLIRGYAIIDDAKESESIGEEWMGVVTAYLESVFLMYLVGNVLIEEVKCLENMAKDILKNNKVSELAPFVDFML